MVDDCLEFTFVESKGYQMGEEHVCVWNVYAQSFWDRDMSSGSNGKIHFSNAKDFEIEQCITLGNK